MAKGHNMNDNLYSKYVNRSKGYTEYTYSLNGETKSVRFEHRSQAQQFEAMMRHAGMHRRIVRPVAPENFTPSEAEKEEEFAFPEIKVEEFEFEEAVPLA